MNKFTIAEINNSTGKELNEENPVLVKIHLGSKYYLHKGKKTMDCASRFLDDVWRGIRGKQYPNAYHKVVTYCKKYPAINTVSVEIIMNAEPSKILAKEDAMYKTIHKDSNCLNDAAIEPYKPEWMLRDKFMNRCDDCPTNGTIGTKKVKFTFCPLCGKSILNKKK